MFVEAANFCLSSLWKQSGHTTGTAFTQDTLKWSSHHPWMEKKKLEISEALQNVNPSFWRTGWSGCLLTVCQISLLNETCQLWKTSSWTEAMSILMVEFYSKTLTQITTIKAVEAILKKLILQLCRWGYVIKVSKSQVKTRLSQKLFCLSVR